MLMSKANLVRLDKLPGSSELRVKITSHWGSAFQKVTLAILWGVDGAILYYRRTADKRVPLFIKGGWGYRAQKYCQEPSGAEHEDLYRKLMEKHFS